MKVALLSSHRVHDGINFILLIQARDMPLASQARVHHVVRACIYARRKYRCGCTVAFRVPRETLTDTNERGGEVARRVSHSYVYTQRACRRADKRVCAKN